MENGCSMSNISSKQRQNKKCRIAVVNYGMGNIGSVVNSLHCLGAETIVAKGGDDFKNIDAIILPGVGAFPQAMENFNKLDLKNRLEELVLQQKKPFLGICLGMQLLAKSSEEQELTEGLRWIDGRVVALKLNEEFRVPHVGWNNLCFKKEDDIFNRLTKESHYFYDHSYHFVCDDKDAVLATTNYGVEMVSVLRKEHIFATQFHPEKSQRSGLILLRNFLNYVSSVSAARGSLC